MSSMFRSFVAGLAFGLGLWFSPAHAQTSVKIDATQGAAPASSIVPNNTNGVKIKAAPGTVYSVQVGGIGSAPAYLKLYDTAVAPTCGSGTPVKRIIIPAAATAANGAGYSVSFGTMGARFSNGIGYCVTTGIADNDTGAPAASTFLVNVDWE